MRAGAVIPTLMALLFTSCVRVVQDTSMRPAVPAPVYKTAVAKAMERHIQNAVDAGDGDLRIAALRRKLAANPGDLPSRMEIGRAYLEAGYPDIALEHYRLAAARFPESAEIAVLLSKTFRMLKMPVEAKATLQDFIARQPAAPADVFSWLAIMQDESQDYTAAEQNHRRAAERQANSDLMYNNLGYNLLLQGRNEEAAAEFRKALDIAPASPVARNNLGLAMSADPNDAIMHWQSVSDPATAHNNMAAVLIEKGNFADARKELELALRYKQDHQAALHNLRLVSELDGRAGQLPLLPGGAFWRRFLHVLIGEPQVSTAAEPVNAALK
jgi:tetratricopeptide (TPR) repeat protein